MLKGSLHVLGKVDSKDKRQNKAQVSMKFCSMKKEAVALLFCF